MGDAQFLHNWLYINFIMNKTYLKQKNISQISRGYYPGQHYCPGKESWQMYGSNLIMRCVPSEINVGVFTDRGGTIGWLMSDDALVVVDTQFPNSAEKLIEVIKEKTDRKLDILLNTHHHGDHSGGNIAFKEMVNKVVAHKNSKANQQRVAEERNQVEKQLYPGYDL